MRVTFWGARGTFPATGADFTRYGGDTMCIEVMCGETRIILDAGSGLRALGTALDRTGAPVSAHIVLSHLHLDHIMGLTQFAPFWRDDARIVLHASNESVGREPSRTVFAVINRPLFPVDAGELPAAVGVHEFEIGAAFAPEPGVSVHTFALSHQGASAGIVVEHGGRKLCYVTDHEHGDAAADARVIRAATGADMLIYDATFSDAEMPEHRGWGHSSWEEGLRVKEKAGASLLALAHHDPDRIDAHLDRRAEAAAKKSANVFFAKQGMTVDL